MSPLDRALLAVYSFLFTVLIALFSAVMLGWTAPLYFFRDLFAPVRPELFWPFIAIVILTGLRLFWISLSRPRGKHVVLAETSLGQVKVSFQAIESLVEKVVSQFNGIRDVKPRIIAVPQGVGIQVRASVTPDVNVPEVSREIQNRIKERILKLQGLPSILLKFPLKTSRSTSPGLNKKVLSGLERSKKHRVLLLVLVSGRTDRFEKPEKGCSDGNYPGDPGKTSR